MEPYTGGASFWLRSIARGPTAQMLLMSWASDSNAGTDMWIFKADVWIFSIWRSGQKTAKHDGDFIGTNEFAPFCSTRFSSPRQLLSRTTCRNQTQDPSSKSRPRTHTARPMVLCTQVACERVRLGFTQTAPRRTVPRSMPARGRREAILGEAETQQIHGLSEGHQMLQQACCATASFTWRLPTPNCFQTAQKPVQEAVCTNLELYAQERKWEGIEFVVLGGQ